MRQLGSFTRPPRTHFRSAGLNFTQLRHLSFNSLVLHFNFTTGVDPFHYSGRVGPQEVALSACLGLACLSCEVFSLLDFKSLWKSKFSLNVFKYLLLCVSLLDWTISGQAALSRIGDPGYGRKARMKEKKQIWFLAFTVQDFHKWEQQWESLL